MTETLDQNLGQGEALPESNATEQLPVESIDTAPAVEPAKPVDDKPRDETGKFKKKSLEDAVKEASEKMKLEQGKPVAPATAPTDEIKAPDHWPAEFKDGFSKLPTPEAKKLYLEAVKNVEAAHTKRSQELAPKMKIIEGIEQRAKGATPEQVFGFIDYYSKLEQGFRQNPVKTIEFLAQQAGIDLKKHYSGAQVESDEYEYTDPLEKTVQEITQKVDQRLTAYEQMLKQQTIAKAQAEIDAELAKKDASGNPLYPHFQKLEPLMVKLKTNGLGDNFSELYEKALLLDPDLRTQFEQEKQAKWKAEQEAARQQYVEKAKKAATHLNGSAPAKVSTRARTIDEAVAMARQQISTI